MSVSELFSTVGIPCLGHQRKEALKDRQQRQKEQRAEAKKQQTSPATG